MEIEGFKNPHDDFGADLKKMGLQIAFEAGKDEYERCIWKMAEESPTGTFIFDTRVINCPSLRRDDVTY